MKRFKGPLNNGPFWLLLFIFCGLLPVIYCPWSVVYAAVDDIIEHIQKEYSVVKDIKGRFSQRSFLKDLERTEDYSGRFFIKKPSYIRWEYSRPRDEEVIINGDRLWIYRKAEGQVLRSVFEEGSYSQLPIALLNGLGDLRKDFYVKTTGDTTLELTPRHKMGIIKKIELVTDTNGFPVKGFTIFDLYDNSVTITIDDVVLNTGLDDSLFSFQIPAGVEVFDLNQ
jgi:outer membrane lipoprotein carrier protein